MGHREDIEKILVQEKTLVFEVFDEATAFELGSRIRNFALEDGRGVAIEISLWDRRLFYATTPGATADNQEWVRRKFNVVRRFLASSYRLVLEQDREDRMFPPHRAVDVEDYALAGGGFPIRAKGAGVIGVAIVSGLPQREDHNLVVKALAAVLGADAAALALAQA
ncbi:heme-degrading domain-containing protein [Phyllobacterium phragmitis]|uniref:UPF0303 protein C5748_02810 n=1 Tax=Phyllobacterium phragmitis TaxID=2670329 RepID=A0A2S9IXB8_9HYPH|nr:heme-degrading domain-containing protein [Phyllobacterium phragmitis]PRD45169.1 heme-degrading domain-containing protein [Phyllobacterium phragmitis]